MLSKGSHRVEADKRQGQYNLHQSRVECGYLTPRPTIHVHGGLGNRIRVKADTPQEPYQGGGTMGDLAQILTAI